MSIEQNVGIFIYKMGKINNLCVFDYQKYY
uniref:Uncharacterized protein n=1 Tax=Siphoviridae sp. ctOVO10 TaxID=2826311 RepID=A0A8S5M2U2_9CAUD|nr:MAG TPA: hypothetical protein [Siphoviridae sp. ctOVO10]DAP46485.1 MAG TPA: hypothetical protein [Caudoviricetes sp.]